MKKYSWIVLVITITLLAGCSQQGALPPIEVTEDSQTPTHEVPLGEYYESSGI